MTSSDMLDGHVTSKIFEVSRGYTALKSSLRHFAQLEGFS